MGKKRKAMKSNAGKLIAGALFVSEGTGLAVYGTRYLRFMEKYGLADAAKATISKLGIESPVVLAGIGLAEAASGINVIRKAHL
jgi:hypothetical protein